MWLDECGTSNVGTSGLASHRCRARRASLPKATIACSGVPVMSSQSLLRQALCLGVGEQRAGFGRLAREQGEDVRADEHAGARQAELREEALHPLASVAHQGPDGDPLRRAWVQPEEPGRAVEPAAIGAKATRRHPYEGVQ